MLKIRLQRFGKKNQPSFRFVATDSRNSTKSGKFLEILGFYNPRNKERKINAVRAKHWISYGAKLSGTVNNLFIDEKIIEGNKVGVAPHKKVEKKDVSSAPNSSVSIMADGGNSNKKEDSVGEAQSVSSEKENAKKKIVPEASSEKSQEADKEEKSQPDATANSQKEEKEITS